MGGNAFQQSHNAYILIYEKAEKKPLKIICSPENVSLIKAQPRSVISKLDEMLIGSKQAALSCDGTAIPREDNNKTTNLLEEESKTIDDSNNLVRLDTDKTMKSARASATKSATANTSRRETAFSDAEMSNSETPISARKQASA